MNRVLPLLLLVGCTTKVVVVAPTTAPTTSTSVETTIPATTEPGGFRPETLDALSNCTIERTLSSCLTASVEVDKEPFSKVRNGLIVALRDYEAALLAQGTTDDVGPVELDRRLQALRGWVALAR